MHCIQYILTLQYAHFSLYPTFLLTPCPKLENSQLSTQLSQLSQLSQKRKVEIKNGGRQSIQRPRKPYNRHLTCPYSAKQRQNNFSHGRGTKKRAWPATPKLGPNNFRTPAKSFLIEPLMMNHK